jgi:ArsR family transcriptional regulator
MSKDAYEEHESSDVCASHCIHTEIVEKVESRIMDDETIYDLADFFKCFGDSTRMKILNALSIHEMCVHDMSALLRISQSAVSHQLRTLKNARLVKFRREGKVIYYSLDDEHVETIFIQGLAHVTHRTNVAERRNIDNG